jgi:GlpG protein
MRIIGHLDTEAEARVFGDYLYVCGVSNEIEVEREGRWAVWVHDEDNLSSARELLERFRGNPQATEFRDRAAEAAVRREEESALARAVARRRFTAQDVFVGKTFLGMGRLTAVLIGLSVLVWLTLIVTKSAALSAALQISNIKVSGGFFQVWKFGLTEVWRGEIWRLLTPIFVHTLSNPLHLLFNMLWMKELGTLIERRLGSRYLAALVLTTGVVSNLGQYFWEGPDFCGMSGVVYGLLGFAWIKGKYDPRSGFALHPTILAMMLIWLLFGFTNVLRIANAAHTVGLLVGMLLGAASAAVRAR